MTRFLPISIAAGSKSDLPKIENPKPGALQALNAIGVRWSISILSAHRNSDDVAEYARDVLAAGAEGPKVIIAPAGYAAALAGSLAAHTHQLKVIIGVPLSSEAYPDAQDAVMSMFRMPPGVPVLLASGIDAEGVYQAAISACQILAISDPAVMAGLIAFTEKKAAEKPPEINFITSDTWQPPETK